MYLVGDLQKRLKEFNKGLEDNTYLIDAIHQYEYIIIEMNTEDQLYEKGINALGVDISDYMPYSPLTIEIKMEKGQPYDRVTLRDTGDFEASFWIDIKKDSFVIQAADSKAQKLTNKYGDQILGLTPENMRELMEEYIKPYIYEQRDKLLYGKKR